MATPSHEIITLRNGQLRGIDYVEDGIEPLAATYGSGLEIHNFLSEDIFLQDRLGLVTRIPAETEQHRRRRQMNAPMTAGVTGYPNGLPTYGVSLVYSFSFHQDDMLTVTQRYTELAEHSRFFRKILEGVERASRTQQNGYGKVIMVRTVITLAVSDVRDCDKPRYLQELGIIVANKRTVGQLHHPENMSDVIGIRSNNDFRECSLEDDPARISLKAYCNTEVIEYSRLYIKLAGGVQEIPIVYDITGSRHGIVVHSKRNVNVARDEVTHHAEYYSFEEAFVKLGVATSVHDAMQWGMEKNKDAELKLAELTSLWKEQTHDLNIAKLKYEELEFQFKREENEYRRKHEMLKLERERLERELKMEQDRRQYNTRMGFEVFKQSIGLFGNVLGFTLQVLKHVKT